jgi:hypothetical protein
MSMNRRSGLRFYTCLGRTTSPNGSFPARLTGSTNLHLGGCEPHWRIPPGAWYKVRDSERSHGIHSSLVFPKWDAPTQLGKRSLDGKGTSVL